MGKQLTPYIAGAGSLLPALEGNFALVPFRVVVSPAVGYRFNVSVLCN
jgi:hypothetical protein